MLFETVRRKAIFSPTFVSRLLAHRCIFCVSRNSEDSIGGSVFVEHSGNPGTNFPRETKATNKCPHATR